MIYFVLSRSARLTNVEFLATILKVARNRWKEPRRSVGSWEKYVYFFPSALWLFRRSSPRWLLSFTHDVLYRAIIKVVKWLRSVY